MTDKELVAAKVIVAVIISFIVGIGIGTLITAERINSEIRTDQLDLQAQVDEIMAEKVIIDSLTQKLILHIEQLELERERLRDLQLKLNKGEKGGFNE